MKQAKIRYIDSIATDTIAMGAAGANKGFAEALNGLHSAIETFGAADGSKFRVHQCRFHVRMYSEKQFGAIPVVIQTAGAFVDTVDMDVDSIEQILDGAIDDVFGYQAIGNFSMAKRIPSEDATSASGLEFGLERTYQLPGNLLQVLNKEVETERLQSLVFGMVGKAINNSQNITIDVMVEMLLTKVSKKIVLR